MYKKISLAMLLVLGLTCTSFAATKYVAAGSTGTGASWTSAMGSLDAALAAVTSGDTVLVAEGIYVPTGATFTVPDGVTVIGGYNGYLYTFNTTTKIGQFLNPKTYQVVLSGDTNVDDAEANLYGNPDAMDNLASRADNKLNLVTLSGNATLRGLAFYHAGTTMAAGGKAIACTGSTTVTVDNCEFRGNVGVESCIAGSSANLTVSNCYFTGNAASQALVRNSGPLTVSKCTLKGNSNSGEVSHGFYWQTSASGTFNMSDCLVIDSISGEVSAFGSVYIRGSNSSTVNISKCVFRNDEADANSTMLYNSGNPATMTFNLTNSLWAGCEGNTGNATILIRPRYTGATTTVNITNCTVADCNDAGATAGIKAYSGSGLTNAGLTLNIKNSILWGNGNGTRATAQVLWDTTSLTFTDTTYNPFKISYSCIDTTDPNNYPAIKGSIPLGLLAVNPQFVGNGDYHLASTSPCIDRGNPADTYANEPKYQNGCRINMGAYGNTAEAAVTAGCVALTADATGDCKVNAADLQQVRVQWLGNCKL